MAPAKRAADDFARAATKARVDVADMRDPNLTVGNDGWTTAIQYDADFTAEERREVERLVAILPRGEMQLRVMEGVVDRINGRPPDIFGWEPSIGPTGTTRLATCTTLPFDRAGVCAVLFALPLKPLRITVSAPSAASAPAVSAAEAAEALEQGVTPLATGPDGKVHVVAADDLLELSHHCTFGRAAVIHGFPEPSAEEAIRESLMEAIKILGRGRFFAVATATIGELVRAVRALSADVVAELDQRDAERASVEQAAAPLKPLSLGEQMEQLKKSYSVAELLAAVAAEVAYPPTRKALARIARALGDGFMVEAWDRMERERSDERREMMELTLVLRRERGGLG